MAINACGERRCLGQRPTTVANTSIPGAQQAPAQGSAGGPRGLWRPMAHVVTHSWEAGADAHPCSRAPHSDLGPHDALHGATSFYQLMKVLFSADQMSPTPLPGYFPRPAKHNPTRPRGHLYNCFVEVTAPWGVKMSRAEDKLEWRRSLWKAGPVGAGRKSGDSCHDRLHQGMNWAGVTEGGHGWEASTEGGHAWPLSAASRRSPSAGWNKDAWPILFPVTGPRRYHSVRPGPKQVLAPWVGLGTKKPRGGGEAASPASVI